MAALCRAANVLSTSLQVGPTRQQRLFTASGASAAGGPLFRDGTLAMSPRASAGIREKEAREMGIGMYVGNL
jgi:hypothetical protein